MRNIVLYLLLIFIISCKHENKKLILFEKNKNYEFEIYKIEAKEKAGVVQCDKYKELKTDSLHTYYYGPDLKELLAFLNQTKTKRINLAKSSDVFYILKINNLNLKNDSILKIVKNRLMKYYNLKEKTVYTKEKIILLMIDDYQKIEKYIDTSKTKGEYSISNNKMVIKNTKSQELSNIIQNYYTKYNVYMHSKDTFNISLTMELPDNFNEFLNNLKNIGISSKKDHKDYKYYYYQQD